MTAVGPLRNNLAVNPALQAAIDRFWLDGATLIYLASLVDDTLAARRCPSTAWTVRQTLAHLAESPVWYADAAEHLASGRPGFPSDPDPTARNAEQAARHADTPIEELATLLAVNRARALDALRALPSSRYLEFPGGHLASAVANEWSLHYAEHAFDFLEALPELRTDALLIDWAFWADFEDDALNRRREALIRQVRKALADEEKRQTKRYREKE